MAPRTILLAFTALYSAVHYASAVDNGVARLPVLGYNSVFIHHNELENMLLMDRFSMECIPGGFDFGIGNNLTECWPFF